jgi:hypothetical protein
MEGVALAAAERLASCPSSHLSHPPWAGMLAPVARSLTPSNPPTTNRAMAGAQAAGALDQRVQRDLHSSLRQSTAHPSRAGGNRAVHRTAPCLAHGTAANLCLETEDCPKPLTREPAAVAADRECGGRQAACLKTNFDVWGSRNTTLAYPCPQGTIVGKLEQSKGP